MSETTVFDSEIRLGLMVPASGLVEMYGSEIARAGQVAVAEINEEGGVLGKKLRLIIEDDGSLPATALAAANRLIHEQNCLAIIGNLLSNSRIAVANKVAEPSRVPYLNFSFYEGSILSRYFFHFAALPNQQIEKMIPYMAGHYGSKMFFAGSNYEWPRGSIDAAKKILKDAGGEIVGEEYLPIGQRDVAELLRGVERSGADVFVPYFAGEDQVNLLTRFTEKKLKEKMAVVMGHYDEAMVSNLPPEVREGFFSSNTYFMSLDTAENETYKKNLLKLPGVTGIWPAGNGILTNFGEGTYLCVKAFARALQAVGSEKREDLIEGLETVQVRGPQGSVIMDPLTHHARVNTHLARCGRDGTFSIVETFGQIDPVIPERYAGNIGKFKHRLKNASPGVPLKSGDRDPSAMGLASVNDAGEFSFGSETFLHLTGIAPELLKEKNLLALLNRTGPETLPGRISHLFQDGETEALFIRGMYGADRSPRLLSFKVFRHPARSSEPGADFPVIVEARPRSRTTTTNQAAAPRRVEPEPPSGAEGGVEVFAAEILNRVDIGVIATDESGAITSINQYACRLFGYESYELIGTPVHLLLPPQFREKHKDYFAEFVASEDAELAMGRRGDIAGYRKDGSIFPAEGSISRVRGPDGWKLVASIKDKTAQREYERKLIWNATHDPLTKLANRDLIVERLENALVRSRSYQGLIGLLFIDLDDFKLINDSYGHDVGDELLVEVANRLIDTVRPGDTVARFGGDEFVILCENLNKPGVLEGLADRIIASLMAPFHFFGEEIVVTGSIGLALGQGGTPGAKDLFRNADAAMYAAKEVGRNTWKRFDEKIHVKSKSRLSIASGLHGAIERDELDVKFHPIHDAVSERIVGAEILLRWRPPGGEVSPGLFIPIAEMTGSIFDLGLWVFEKACRALARWPSRTGSGPLPILSVNISTRQLSRKSLVDEVKSILESTGADPGRIFLEITETALMSDIESNIYVLRELAELGFGVSVDDFGTGYSSLSLLAKMPVHHLKIDRSFIENIEKDERMQNIVTAVINMAHALQLKVIAEGVETEAQSSMIRKLNCDMLQGFYYYRPLPAAEMEAALSQ